MCWLGDVGMVKQGLIYCNYSACRTAAPCGTPHPKAVRLQTGYIDLIHLFKLEDGFHLQAAGVQAG
jgi:hypothetical protein